MKPIVWTPNAAAKIVRVVRKVDGRGNSNAIKTYDFSDQPLWFGLVDYETRSGKTYWWNYSTALFASPFATDPIPSTSGTGGAINTYEVDSTDSKASGYSIVTSGAKCGDIIGVSPIPINGSQRYPVTGRFHIDGEDDNVFYYEFRERNDPIIKGP